MKIILTAFDQKMWSRPMDVPENTTPTFRLALMQPIQAITGFAGDKIGSMGPLDTLCEFEWTGKMDMESGARIYCLRDIEKINRPRV